MQHTTGYREISTRIQFSANCRRAALVLAIVLTLPLVGSLSLAHAGMVTLESGNSSAHFRTESTDVGTKGLHAWSVDGVNHVMQQWFWLRVGDSGPEMSLDNLTLVSPELAVDTDGDLANDFMFTKYRDADESFEIQLRYILLGGPESSGTSDLAEVIRFENLSDETLDLHFFQYVDFDVNGTADDDDLQITGFPENTAHQSDPFYRIAETVVTPPPTHYEVHEVGAPDDILTRLNDLDPTTLADNIGPLELVDGAWSFQWDFEITPGDSFLISKDKNIRPEASMPEPATAMLVVVGLLALASTRVRRRVG